MVNAKEYLQKARTSKIDTDSTLQLVYPKEMKISNKNIFNRIVKDFPTLNFNYLMLGDVGCGKTFMMEFIKNNIIEQFLNLIKSSNDYKSSSAKYINIEANNIYRKYLENLSNDCTFFPETNMPFFFFDDIGNERPSTSSSHSYISSIIESRYDYWKGLEKIPDTNVKGELNINFSVSILTSNLSSQELLEYYGHRVIDRINEMFTIMKFKNESFRKIHKEVIVN